MAKFLHAKHKLFNLENVDYIDIGEGKTHKVKIVFSGSNTLEFSGDEAEQLRTYLAELDVVDRLPFFS